MSKVIDFVSFKQKKQESIINTSEVMKNINNEELEQYYKEWFKRNKITTPTSIYDFIKIYYCSLRYLEATNNSLSINSALTDNITDKDLTMLKDNVTDWLAEMIEFMKSIK